MPACTSFATLAAVRISLALARISPVSVFTTSWASILPLEVVGRHRQAVDAGVLELAHVARRDAAAFLDDDLVADADLEARGLAAQALRHERRARRPVGER